MYCVSWISSPVQSSQDQLVIIASLLGRASCWVLWGRAKAFLEDGRACPEVFELE